MPAGNTYTQIASTTVGTATQTVTLSSIPSTYTDLILIVSGTPTTTGSGYLRVNGDTATNYSSTGLRGDGVNPYSYRRLNETQMLLTFQGVNNSPANWVIQLMNYANTTTNKAILNRFNSPESNEVLVNCGLYRSTSAINSITIYMDGSANFPSGSTLSLYGITAA
jgi:hypothetical protein